jgi:hypothetical protein
MPTMLNAALAAFTAERSGSASALMTAGRQVGATIGVAVLGTVIATVYKNQLHLPGLPAAAMAVARSSVAAGVLVAKHLPAPFSGVALGAVHHAYANGVDMMLWVCAAIAITAAVLAALFIPRTVAVAPDGAADSTVADSTGPAELSGQSAGVAGALTDGNGGE